MGSIEVYEKAYGYYCQSCERANEKPYPFETYCRNVPIWEALEYVKYNERDNEG